MSPLRERLYKPLMVALAVGLLLSASFSQKRLNKVRADLGLTRMAPLENAPPVLAFTTIALGGFRGLIANAMWIRASDLQDDGKYFEMVQLADWITKLQPHFVSVWVNLAWNMAYNISVKFKDASDRWLWVQRGIELIRDDGLRYNPQEPLLYREIAWFFQHKMGADLDDAHFYYKRAWADLMSEFFPDNGRAKYEELLDPKTEEAKARVKRMREKYKLEPSRMKKVDDTYGPLDWRLPEAHAIYWAITGMDKGRNKKEDLITLRRVIYQSMQLAFQRGRLLIVKNASKEERRYSLEPNLDLVPRVNAAYEDMMEQDEQMRDHMKTGHRNFLRDAAYFLYTHNRMREAQQWYNYLAEKYPGRGLLDFKPETLPSTMTLEEYAVARVTGDVGETSRNKTISNIKGIIAQAYYALALGEDDRYAGFERLAQIVWKNYQDKITLPSQIARVQLDPLPQLKQEVLDGVLDPENGFDPLLQLQLRTRLNLPAQASVEKQPETPVE